MTVVATFIYLVPNWLGAFLVGDGDGTRLELAFSKKKVKI